MDAALRTFWERGFDATTLDDLTTATGLNRPSLYGAFGDKAALFALVLDRYQMVGDAAVAEALARDDPPAAVEAFLRALVIAQTGGADRERPTPRGCLVSNCAAVGGGGTAHGARLRGARDAMVDKLADRLAAFVDDGALPADYPARERAGLLVDITHGFAHRARAGEGRDALLADVPARAEAVLG